MRHLYSLLLALALTSCQHMMVKEHQLTSIFNEAEFRKALEATGSGTISGSGLIRQAGGGVVTCAGYTAFLVPVNSYSTERIVALYGSDERGYNSSNNIKFIPENPAYIQSSRQTTCDAQGFFKFDNVKDGEYFVTTTVTWFVSNISQGGALFQKVKVVDGQSIDIVLSP